MRRFLVIAAAAHSLAPTPSRSARSVARRSTLDRVSSTPSDRRQQRAAENDQKTRQAGLNFWDEHRLEVQAGDGGDGCLSFRREKFVAFGGPNGGNGGRGGSIVLVCDGNLNTLGVARRRTAARAPSGSHGKGSNKHAKAAADAYVRVPPGTVVREAGTNRVAGELSLHGDALLVARGGRGGRGNAAFKTARRTAPRLAERGQFGARRTLLLELQLVADVGLVGLPNAGKSTFLRTATAARPKVADYAFTTLVPNLGVWEPAPYRKARDRAGSGDEKITAGRASGKLATRARRSAVGGATKNARAKLARLRGRTTSRAGDKKPFRSTFDVEVRDEGPRTGGGVDDFGDRQLDAILGGSSIVAGPPESAIDETAKGAERGLVLADVPGLIEDAHLGAGMGDAFLRHVERCAALLHVVDASSDDPVADLKVVARELDEYSPILAEKPRVVLLNKVDAVSDEARTALVEEIRGACGHARVCAASAATGKGVEAALRRLRRFCDRNAAAPPVAGGPRVDLDPPFANSRDADKSWSLEDGSDRGFSGQWRVDSKRLETVAAMTKFDQPDAVARFSRILKALGVADELEARGAVKGDLVMIGDDVDLEYDPVGWAPYAELRRAGSEGAGADEHDADETTEGEFLDFEGAEDDLDFESFDLGGEDFAFLLEGDDDVDDDVYQG